MSWNARQVPATPYPLVLLDAVMPEIDGFTLAEQILRHPELAGVPIMMLTSTDRQKVAARCRALGLGAYLIKPVKSAELLDALRSVLDLPRRSGPATLPARRVPIASPTARPGALRVLLAEDNVVNQLVAERMLTKQGHAVVVVGDGAKALTALERDTFDLVLMDVQMPVLDGFAATAAIRAREQTTGRHLPIVALTAHAMKGDRERCLVAGMDDYLTKPVKADKLFQVLARWGGGGGGPE